ncbi:MAG: mevalonate kinase [Candidatus Aenigmatarchaeota archaeon]
MVKASAPGKLMLFGEHAVVYERPCIVTAVNHRMSVSINKRNDDKIIVNAPEVNVKDYAISIDKLNGKYPRETSFVLTAAKNFFDKYQCESGLDIETHSEFSSKFGFGSSSAVTASTIKALSELFGARMSKKELFDISYKTVLDVQKVGSGFDVASAIYGGTLYFVKGGKTIEEMNIKEIPLIVGYTGVKADTSTLVKKVSEKLETETEKINNIFDKIGNIVIQAKEKIKQSEWGETGALMNVNQKYLEMLGVSSPELDMLISSSNKAGVYGSKLSGAGGGDCMIALASKENVAAVSTAIEKAGGIIIPVETNVEGVKIEKQ